MDVAIAIVILIDCFCCIDDTVNCSNGEVRLFGGDTVNEGTIEVCLGGVWGSICHFGWGPNDIDVICSQLGYSSAGNVPVYAAFFGQSTGPILMDNVICAGTESTIVDCPLDISPRTACTHFQDAGVRCLVKSKKCLNNFIVYSP